jgi:hypothetical protein
MSTRAASAFSWAYLSRFPSQLREHHYFPGQLRKVPLERELHAHAPWPVKLPFAPSDEQLHD